MTSMLDLRQAFGARMTQRRADIMRDWEARVAADPMLVTGSSLPRVQLYDHLTALLEDFEHRLKSTGEAATESSENASVGDAAAHGLHRWQQGFDLAELVNELGRLNESVVAAIDRAGAEPPFEDHRALLAEVRAIWAAINSDATSTSAAQFFKLQQLEAMGHVQDLEQALVSLQWLKNQQAALWQEAAHDLRGSLGVVNILTASLNSPAVDPDKRTRSLATLERNVRALNDILEDVTSLARLQGGQEVRVIGEVEVSKVLGDLASEMEGLAQERKLELLTSGPTPYIVQGDATKIRRIVQNLVLNALRYTRRGSVEVSWGPEPGRESIRWVVRVEDTGPGLQLGPGSPLAGAISVASDQARDMSDGVRDGGVVHVSVDDAAPVLKPDARGSEQKAGEGLGLSIVKRLCTLLDATIEIDSRIDRGTAFTILLPVRYEA